MLSRRKVASFGMLSYLLCCSISFTSIAMERNMKRELSEGTMSVLSSFFGENALDEIENSIETINIAHGIRLFRCKDNRYILKSNGKLWGNYYNECTAFNLFKEKKTSEGVNICAPCFCNKFSYNIRKKKYYAIYPYIENIDEHTLFKFINYSDYKEGKPSTLRTFDERKDIWVDLVSQLIKIIKCLFNDYKILHCDWKYDNVLFNIDEKNEKLIVTLIDFDTICDVDYAILNDGFKCDLYGFCCCLVQEYLLPMFYGCDKSDNKNNKYCLNLDCKSDDYFLGIDSCLDKICNDISKYNPPKTIKTYSSYINDIEKKLIEGEK